MKKLQEIVREHKVLTIITGIIVLSAIAPIVTNTYVFIGIVLLGVWGFALCSKK